MDDFVLLTDRNSIDGPSQLVLLATRHISEVRPLGNPISDGAIVTMITGREVHTNEPFDEIVQKLFG